MGPIEAQTLRSNGLDLFANILKSVNNQRLIMDFLVVLGLLNKIIGSNLTCGAYKNQDFEKKGHPYTSAICTIAPPIHRFVDSLFLMGGI